MMCLHIKVLSFFALSLTDRGSPGPTQKDGINTEIRQWLITNWGRWSEKDAGSFWVKNYSNVVLLVPSHISSFIWSYVVMSRPRQRWTVATLADRMVDCGGPKGSLRIRENVNELFMLRCMGAWARKLDSICHCWHWYNFWFLKNMEIILLFTVESLRCQLDRFTKILYQ